MGTSGTNGRESWWSRIGTAGQVLTALIGLAAALVPVVATKGVPGLGSSQRQVVESPGPVARTSASEQHSTRPPTPRAIVFTISDQLTQGVEEETIVVSIEGRRVASLHASKAVPVVSKRLTAAKAGSFGYVVDAEFSWYDELGQFRVGTATGRGSVRIDHGTRLDVYTHLESGGGVSLSLESAGES